MAYESRMLQKEIKKRNQITIVG